MAIGTSETTPNSAQPGHGSPDPSHPSFVSDRPTADSLTGIFSNSLRVQSRTVLAAAGVTPSSQGCHVAVMIAP
ncbi:hypothetical protein VB780_02365 [Leptolyngbya sp. CCNP1308]|uniref:hypothetical protein n=1 Tax=Leptolyngbya sp. CCNP1308 TaxID=3110255 RepID=UPI002B21FC65|nr:hypothetical protein [Leptolyngbya sp. CCNP1308]MEA5447396.1 hypothetical protein [Leptolyngbya sp. CCNP1308]